MTNMETLKKYKYAHRGFHDKPQIPENSLPAFRRAIEHKFGAEFDVHLLKDGNLVVFHDNDLMRCTGEEGIIEDLTLDQVKKLRLEGTENQIPTLDEVLEIFEPTGLPLIIELKHRGSNHLALTEAVVKRLDTYTGDFCIESFDPRVVADVKKLRPEIIRGQLAADFTKDPGDLPAYQIFLLTDLFFNFMTKPNFIAYKFEDRENPINQKCIKKGIQAFSWTIRTKEDFDTCLSEGSIPIFETFDPDL